LFLNQVRDRRDACPTAGCKFEFSAKTIQPLMKLLREELWQFQLTLAQFAVTLEKAAKAL
jgi:hypothetical protein